MIGNRPTSNGIIPRLTVVKGKKRGINKQEDVAFINHSNEGNEFSYLRPEIEANLPFQSDAISVIRLPIPLFYFITNFLRE